MLILQHHFVMLDLETGNLVSKPLFVMLHWQYDDDDDEIAYFTVR